MNNDELETKKRELDLAKLNAELESLKTGFWKRVGRSLTSSAALIAVAIPAATAIWGHYDKAKELGLQKEKQSYELAMAREKQTEDIRSKYLDRLDDGKSRQRTLRFLVSTAADSSVKTWANNELAIVDKDIAEVERKVAEKEKQMNVALVAERAASGKDRELAESYKRQVEQLRRDKVDLEAMVGPTGLALRDGYARMEKEVEAKFGPAKRTDQMLKASDDGDRRRDQETNGRMKDLDTTRKVKLK